MKSGTASGLQIAFFTFAVLLLATPLTQWLAELRPWSPSARALLEKTIVMCIGGLILFGVPALRRRCLEFLSATIPLDKRAEVAAVLALKPLLPLALAGAYALWHWTAGGEATLARYVAGWLGSDAELAKAFSLPHMVLMLLVAGLVAPVLEELVFRGFLYRAWERRWGWLPAMVLTSALFAVYHPNFWSAFLSSVVFVCLYRRTGSLRAAILAHVVTNVSLWYPLMGRFVVPRDAVAPGDLGCWGLQLACLFVAAIAVPAYVWMARRGVVPR